MLNLAPVGSDDVPRAASWPAHTIIFLIGWYTLGAIAGVRAIYASGSGLDALLPIGYAACLGSWVVADARRRGHPIPMLSESWVFIMAVFVAPVYLVWSRKWRGVGLLALHFFAWLAVAATAGLIAGRIIYGARWLR